MSSNQKLSIFVALRVLGVQKFARMYIHTNIENVITHKHHLYIVFANKVPLII